MVHALERAKEMVKRGGIVIVVHDSRTPPSIELHQGDSHSLAGYLLDHEGFPMVRLADQAVDTLVDSDELALLKHNDFVYRTQIDSYHGFCEWLDKQWDTSYLPGKIHDQIKDGFEEEHDTSIIVHRQATIKSLKAL